MRPRASARAENELLVRTHRGGIHARGPNQQQYLSNIRRFDLTFGIGPAGTGKDLSLRSHARSKRCRPIAVRRIVLVRPAVEAGERLGFPARRYGAES